MYSTGGEAGQGLTSMFQVSFNSKFSYKSLHKRSFNTNFKCSFQTLSNFIINIYVKTFFNPTSRLYHFTLKQNLERSISNDVNKDNFCRSYASSNPFLPRKNVLPKFAFPVSYDADNHKLDQFLQTNAMNEVMSL